MAERTLSDFMDMAVCRTGDTAELIFGYEEDAGEQKPVRLLGFASPADWSDFDIREAAFAYYQEFMQSFLLTKPTKK